MHVNRDPECVDKNCSRARLLRLPLQMRTDRIAIRVALLQGRGHAGRHLIRAPSIVQRRSRPSVRTTCRTERFDALRGSRLAAELDERSAGRCRH